MGLKDNEHNQDSDKFLSNFFFFNQSKLKENIICLFVCVCVQTERCWEGRGDVLNPGSQSPSKHSQKLVLTHAECPSTSWVKKPKNIFRRQLFKDTLSDFLRWMEYKQCSLYGDSCCHPHSLQPPSLPPRVHGRHCAVSTVQDSVSTDKRLSMEAFCQNGVWEHRLGSIS